MNWLLTKLEQDRIDLIEIITVLRNDERKSSYNDHFISRNLSAHMSRLGELERELMERRQRDSVSDAAQLLYMFDINPATKLLPKYIDHDQLIVSAGTSVAVGLKIVPVPTDEHGVRP